MHSRAGIHCSDLVLWLNDYDQTPWRRLEGPYCPHKVQVLHPERAHFTVKLSQLSKYYCSSCWLSCTTEQVRYESGLQMCTIMRFSQVLVLGIENRSQGPLNKGLDGGLDCSDLLSQDNEVLF